MAEFTLTLANGRSVVFDIAEDAEGPACFLLGMRKCGSTLANQVCAQIAEANRRCFVAVGDTMFRNNVLAREWQLDPALAQILRPGVIYGGFRDAPAALFDHPTFLQGRKLIVIRDPRDALVSEYYSSAFSHPVPDDSSGNDAMRKHILFLRERARTKTIEQEVTIRGPALAHSMMQLKPILSMPNIAVVKYEDIVFEKTKLIRKVADVFDLTVDAGLSGQILQRTDLFPENEDPHAFVRQVRPGDHRRKLTGEFISKLNALLAEPLSLFGYEVAAPDA